MWQGGNSVDGAWRCDWDCITKDVGAIVIPSEFLFLLFLCFLSLPHIGLWVVLDIHLPFPYPGWLIFLEHSKHYPMIRLNQLFSLSWNSRIHWEQSSPHLEMMVNTQSEFQDFPGMTVLALLFGSHYEDHLQQSLFLFWGKSISSFIVPSIGLTNLSDIRYTILFPNCLFP